MNWAALKTAISGWVATASGLGASKVMWAASTPAPAKPYIEMRVSAIQNAGLDWIEVDATDPDFPSYVALGFRKMRLQLIAFSDSDFGAVASLGLLERVKSRSILPTIHAALHAAKIGLAFPDPTTSVDGMVNFAQFEPRAILPVLLHTVSQETDAATDDYPGYIESADLVDVERGVTVHVDADAWSDGFDNGFGGA